MRKQFHRNEGFAWTLVLTYLAFNFYLTLQNVTDSTLLSTGIMARISQMLNMWPISLAALLLVLFILYINWQKNRDLNNAEKLRTSIIFAILIIVISLFTYGGVYLLNFLLDRWNLNYWTAHLFFRKYAHFISYFLMAFLIKNALSLSNTPRRFSFFITLYFCVAVALADEIIQAYIPGRTSLMTDVAIDTSGSFFGTILYHLLERRAGKRTVWEMFLGRKAPASSQHFDN